MSYIFLYARGYKVLYRKIKTLIMKYQYEKSKRNKGRFCKELKIFDINKCNTSKKDIYLYFHKYFWNKCPEEIRNHREYFRRNNRGFGEDAFHAMWYLLFKEFSPKYVLEIGIYRGQTLSLFSLLSEKFNLNSEIHGISPFNSTGDNVTKYIDALDYYQDVLLNYDHFGLALPVFHKGLSITNSMIKIINSKKWDLIYIDGNHDYEVAKQDFDVYLKNLNKNGLIILDDASLYTDYIPPSFSTAGHPGPSKIAEEIDTNIFEEILAVGHNRVFQQIKK